MFARFCRERSAQLRSLLATRRVQTNEPGRCAELPGFTAVADRATPLALIELGSGAGLNLNWDRYTYRYTTEDGAVVRAGAHDSAVRIACRLRGGVPPLPNQLPEVAWRVGIDLDPVDLANAEDVRWLRACIWPDRQDRAERLRRAVELARARPVPMIRGDAVDLVRTAIGRAPTGATVCVFHSLLLPYLTDAQAAALRQIRAEYQRVAWIACEPPAHVEPGVDGHLALTLERAGEARVLARAGYHGEWLNWLDAGLADAPVRRGSIHSG